MQKMIGQYDAAVIDKQDGMPHVVRRMVRPHIRVIPERFGGGTLPRKELHEAAEQLTASQAGLDDGARAPRSSARSSVSSPAPGPITSASRQAGPRTASP
jgi:hypothetical protein